MAIYETYKTSAKSYIKQIRDNMGKLNREKKGHGECISFMPLSTYSSFLLLKEVLVIALIAILIAVNCHRRLLYW